MQVVAGVGEVGALAAVDPAAVDEQRLVPVLESTNEARIPVTGAGWIDTRPFFIETRSGGIDPGIVEASLTPLDDANMCSP